MLRTTNPNNPNANNISERLSNFLIEFANSQLLAPFANSIGIQNNAIVLNAQNVIALINIATERGLTADVRRFYNIFLNRAQNASQNRLPRQLTQVQQEARETKNRLLGRY